jgi:hypothetical protein
MLFGKYPTGAITVWQVSDAGRVIWKPAMRLPAEYALAMLNGPVAPQKPAPEPATEPAKPAGSKDNTAAHGWLAAIIAAIAAAFGGKK